MYISPNVTTMIIPDNRCNDASIDRLDLSVFPYLQVLIIGNNCFSNVNVVNFTDFSELLSISIGSNSFTREKSWYGNNPNRKFFLKDCPKVKELIIMDYSFSDFTTCEIEFVPLLERLELGNLITSSYVFHSVAFQLKCTSCTGNHD